MNDAIFPTNFSQISNLWRLSLNFSFPLSLFPLSFSNFLLNNKLFFWHHNIINYVRKQAEARQCILGNITRKNTEQKPVCRRIQICHKNVFFSTEKNRYFVIPKMLDLFQGYLFGRNIPLAYFEIVKIYF